MYHTSELTAAVAFFAAGTMAGRDMLLPHIQHSAQAAVELTGKITTQYHCSIHTLFLDSHSQCQTIKTVSFCRPWL